MRSVVRNRKDFLKSLAGVALAGPVLGRLEAIEDVFSASLHSLARTPWETLGPQALQDRYMLDPAVVYLNHASIGTIPRQVHDARVEYLALCESNPWLYMWGTPWEPIREEVRVGAAGVLGVPPSDLAITHNTTEGFNILANGLPIGPGDEVLFSTLNHDGASVCWELGAERRGFTARRFEFPVADVPGMSVADVVELHRRQIRPETRVLVFPHVDNAVGLRHPLAELVAMAKAEGVEYVAVDGAQTVGMIPLDLAGSGVDAYSASPHKWLQSPKGLGLLYVRADLRAELRPMWVTWGQRRWAGTGRIYEDYGTRNLPEVMALGDAVDFQAALGPAEKERRYQQMRSDLRERVLATPGLEWASPETWDLGASLVAVGISGRSASRVSQELFAQAGIVLRPFETMGLNALRISPNVNTTPSNFDEFFAGIARALG